MFTSGIINVRITLLDTLESINVEFVHFDEYKNIFYLEHSSQEKKFKIEQRVKTKIICKNGVYTFDSVIKSLNPLNEIISISPTEPIKVINRRRFQRFSVKKRIIVEYRRKRVEGKTINISEGGLAFYCKELFPMDEPISIYFWDDQQQFYHNAKVEIRNIFIDENEIKYGVMFKEISQSNYNMLVRFLDGQRNIKYKHTISA